MFVGRATPTLGTRSGYLVFVGRATPTHDIP